MALYDMFAGLNNSMSKDLDLDVGYSPTGEDLYEIDTEYVLPDKMTELSDSNLNIMHLNIHGLINKQDSLSRLLTTLGGRNKVNVVSLNETWLRKDTENKINIPDYNYAGMCRSGKKGGGVGFLVSETVKFREYSLPITELSTLEHFSIEIKTKQNPVLVVSLYRPPNQLIQTSIKDMKIILNILKQDKRPVVICTDHNLDLLKASSHTKTQEFLELTSECGFLCTIGKPTRITHQTATLIDNIFISKEFSLGYKSWILIDDMSDHMPCFISLPQVEVDSKGTVQVVKRKIDEKSMNSIKMELLLIDWPLKLDKLSCEESFNYFHDILMECLDRHCPEKISQKRGKKSVKPWITKGLRKCLNKERSLYKTLLKDRSNVQLIETYKRYKQCLQKNTKACKK